MAELDVGKLSLTIEADGRAAIFELNRVKEAAEGASTDAARAYQSAGDEMADAFEPAAEAAEETADAVRKMGDVAEKTGDAVQTAGQKATKSFNDMIDSADRFGTTMSAGVTAPLLALFGTMVSSASDLTETIGKSEVVFEDQAGKVFAWSENAIENMGLAEESALSFASTFGDMGKGMDVPIAKATEMSMNLTQLSADLASFKNMSADRAAEALTGVYTGETEALKSLGIVMTQANLQAYAYSQGITTQVSAMSQAEQVQLRYQYVMAKTVDAQGDFVRTGGNLANQSRALVQTLKQAGSAFGEVLTPAVIDVVSQLREGALWLAELDEGTKTAILSIGGVTAAIGPLVLAGTKVVKLVTTLKTVLAATPVGLTVGVIALATAAVVGLNDALNKTNDAIDVTSDRYKRFESVLSGGAAAKITADTEELDAIDGRTVTVSWEVSQSPESDQTAWDTFTQKITELGWETKEYTAIGTFAVDEATLLNAEAYKQALIDAATATEDYEGAVNNLNNLLDESLAAQVTEINAQAAEQLDYQARLLNSGVIDRDTYDANVKTIIDGAASATEALENEYEIAKNLNEQYKNGVRSDDYAVTGEQVLALSGGEGLTAEDYQSAIATLNAAREAGEDMSKYQTEAMIVNSQLAQNAVADYEALTAAQEEYSAAVEKANADQENAQTAMEDAEILQAAVDDYITILSKFDVSTEEALAQVGEHLSTNASEMGYSAEEIAGLQQELAALLKGSDGLMSDTEAAAEYGDGGLFASYQEQMQQAIADAEAARTTAAETFATTLNDLTGDFSAAETQMLLEMTASTGAAISEADAAMVASTESMIDQMAQKLSEGGPEVADSASGMIEAISNEVDAQPEGVEIGAAITAGITSGLNHGTGTLYRTVRNIVNKAIAEAKETADIHSPSGRARREIGIPFIQGISVGAEEETPNMVRTIRQSVEHMVTGATQVISHGSITVPAITAAATPIDYAKMGEAMTDAVSALQLAVDINGKRAATIMREDTARQQALRNHEINIGKGRIG